MDSTESKNRLREALKVDAAIASALGSVSAETKVLGEGGNALVVGVNFFGREAVAKIVCEPSGSEKFVRFLNEYRRLVTLPPHHGVVRLFQFDLAKLGAEVFPVIFMERCQGHLGGEKPVKEPRLREIVEQLCEGLTHIHSHGIVHRDLKPQNVLVRRDSSVAIADFGIAWFDPALHERDLVTAKGDRMANFEFAAPEQLVKGGVISPATDLYALGQLINWLVLGETVRGTARPTLATRGVEFGPYDAVVERLVRQDPRARPQTAKEVLGILRGEEEARVRQARESDILGKLESFADCLTRISPGARGVVRLHRPEELTRIFDVLANYLVAHPLVWSRGSQWGELKALRKLPGDAWLVDHMEMKVTEGWLYQTMNDNDHQFILLRSEAMPSFGVAGAEGESHEETAWFEGTYIRREEYDDGTALIDGKVVELQRRAEIRIRYLKPRYVLISTKYSAVNLREAQKPVRDFIDQLESSGKMDLSRLEEFGGLPPHEVSMNHR